MKFVKKITETVRRLLGIIRCSEECFDVIKINQGRILTALNEEKTLLI